MAEGLARKKRIRAGHKASATRMLNRIDELLKAEEVDKAQLAQLKMSLTEKLETVKLLDGEILELTEEVDLDDEILQADTYKNNIYQAMVKLDKAAKDAAPPPTETPPTPLSARDTSTTRDYRIKLPKLTIPSFDGDVAQWTSFWDSYDSAVHQNPSLNEVDKFNYLRSFLKGAARDAVSGLMLTAANYQEAIEILKRRFGNRQRIISRHMDIMMNADSVTSHNNVKALRQLYDVMESNVRSLKSFGVTSESYGSLLASILMNKLPSELRLIISRKIGDDDWDFGVILKELLTEVEARERTSSNQANPSSQDKRPSRGQHTVATLQSSNSNPHCSFCGQSHPSERCETVREPEERKQVLLKAGRCFVCLRRGHLARQCRTKVRCSMCGGRHNTAICSKSATPRELEDGHTGQPRNVNSQSTPLNPRAPSFQAPPSHTPTTSSLFVGAKDAVLLQTARVRVYDPDKPDRSMEFRAILDTGSQQSYATQRVKDSLAVQAREKRMMSIMTFGSGERKTQEYDVIKIGVVTLEGENQEMELSTVPLVCQPLLSQPIDLCKSAYQHLHDLELADSLTEGEPMEVDLLIGVDYYWRFVTGDTRRGEGGPVAIRTRLGWVLSGPTAMQMDNTARTYLTTHVLRIDASPHSTQRLEEVLQSFWHLESLGIEDKEGSILDKFSQSIHFKGGHYEVTLPWKSSHLLLPDNLGLSQKRLEGLLQRLKQKPDIMGEYDTIIKRQLQQGIVEEVCQPDGGIPGRVHYLPHHAVVRKDKDTTKVRVVYDASAKATGCSLNECLHKGPKFEQKILEILLRFRTYQVALTSDIEKAFLMVSVSECDRDVLRFLWVEDVNKEPPEIRVLRFARVVFGVSCSPFLLNATLQHHLSQYRNSHLELVEKLTKSMYVDDVISGAQSEEEAYQLYSTSKKILKDGGFNLRKFATNSSSLQQRINSAEETHGVVEAKTKASDSDETYSNATLGTNQSTLPGEQKVLGVRWEIRSDRLCFSFEDIAHLAMTLEPTKRHLVSIVGRFYDPMGYLSPIVIRFKILLQELCRERQDWDQQLTGGLLQKWNNLIQELRCSSTMYLPRCLWTGLPTEDRTCSLYGFCDASKQAYAAVVYLVVKSPSGSSVRFLVSKTRVAPLKSQTIPRLELLSAVLLSRLMRSVTDGLGAELNLSQPHCFTDSKVALYWILGEERVWKQFVQHRVLEVRSVLPGDRWKHCPGTENPADLPSRGLQPMELARSSLWTNGPEWMGHTTESNQFQGIEMSEECAIELRAKDRPAAVSLVATSNCIDVGQIVDCERYSNLHKLLRVTGLMLKYTAILRSKINPTYKPRSNHSIQAEVLWVKVAQKKLTEGDNFERLKKQFKLFCDEEGIWRCGGRLENANVSFHERHPILIPRDHHMATLIVRRAHARVLHNGVKDTLNEVRSRYWLVKGRAFVKKMVHQCVICRKFEGRPFCGPTPPPLPTFRLREDPPFTYTGVDFAGPLYIKTATSPKVWICLYTCCVTRAIHLDVVPDLTTTAFVRSLKRFTSRRGLPRMFVSDNGKTFKAAVKTINAMLQNKEVQGYLSGVGIEWLFNLERAPWWGGVFERMVRMTKRCLRKMIGRSQLTFEELSTIVIEVEGVINSRPLTYLSPDDFDQPLTPAHLLCGRRLLSLPDTIYCKDIEEAYEMTPKHMTKRLTYLNRILNHFWKRWQTEYLSELRDAHRYGTKTSANQEVKVGDIVLVHDDSKPRGFWKLALVEKLVTGRDGLTRGAVLRVTSSGEHGSTLQRPLQRLYPLELSSTTATELGVNDLPRRSPQEAEPIEPTVKVPTRPKRAAAVLARDGLKATALQEQEELD